MAPAEVSPVPVSHGWKMSSAPAKPTTRPPTSRRLALY